MRVARNGSDALVEVRDRGSGMTPDELAQAFGQQVARRIEELESLPAAEREERANAVAEDLAEFEAELRTFFDAYAEGLLASGHTQASAAAAAALRARTEGGRSGWCGRGRAWRSQYRCPGWVPRNQPSSARTVRGGVVNWKAGSGTRQPGPYIASSSFSGRAGTGIGRPPSSH